MTNPNLAKATILTLPGLGNSGPHRWQTRWEAMLPDISRVELGMWNAPLRNPWVTKLEQSLRHAEAPVILVAHSLGCLAAAWWAALAAPERGRPVAGALLVAPPFLKAEDFPILSREFGRLPDGPLPFPTIVVASRDDPYATFDQVARMARGWGAHLVDAGAAGHINAISGLGVWTEGISLLDRLRRMVAAGEGSAALADVQDHYDRAAENWVRESESPSINETNPHRL